MTFAILVPQHQVPGRGAKVVFSAVLEHQISVVFTLNLLIGLLIPPLGASMFLARGWATTMKPSIVEGWPFIVALVVPLFPRFVLTYRTR